MLTQIGDVDKILLRQLPLHQLQQTCSINKFTYQLCKNDNMIQNKIKEASDKAERIVNLIKTRPKIILNTKYSYEKGIIFTAILRYLNNDFEIVFNGNRDKYNVISIYNNNEYMGRRKNTVNIDIESLYQNISKTMTYEELYQFLRHLFYDDLILHI